MPGAGLSFRDDRPEFRWPCSLDLTHAGDIPAHSAVTIGFDLCIEAPERFGFVLHGNLDDSTKFSLAYAKYFSQDSSYLVLAINGDPVSIHLPILKSRLHTGRWHRIVLTFDTKEQLISASVDGIDPSARSYILPRALSVRLTFGSVTRSGEVPAMAIRDVTVLTNDAGEDALTARHHWALGELKGSDAADDLGGLTGFVQHATWLAESHIRWRHLTTIRSSDGISFFSGYDSPGGTILFAGIHALLEYSTRTGETRKIPYRSPRAMVAGQIDFDSNRRRLYGHHPAGGEISRYDSQLAIWSPIDTTVGLVGDYNHHPSFVDPATGDIYLIGGYGRYTAKNHLCRYSFLTRKWENVTMTGDSLEPRSGIALCEAGLPGHYYLCGGEGNASGRHDAGFEYFFDLWTLDLQKKEIRRLWRDDNTAVGDRIIALVNAGTGGRDDLFALFGPSINEPGPLQLYRISASVPGRKPAGEAPDIVPEQWSSVYFDSLYQRFLLVVPVAINADSSEVRVYSLAYPPMNRSDFGGVHESNVPILLTVILAGVALTGLGYGLRYARQRSQTRRRMRASADPGPGAETHAATIRVFGGFKVTDSSGRDITEQFSVRLRHVFLLLLLRTSYDEGSGSGGIGANELADLLWPGSSPPSAKDSRGVAIAALRKLLPGLGGVSVDFKNKRYLVRIERDVRCDYQRFRRAVHVLTSGSGPQSGAAWSELLAICRTGVLLPELSLSWVDPIKAEVFTEFERLASAKLSSSPEEIGGLDLATAEVLLLWDPINEQALRTKLRVLWESGRHGAARVAYEQFTSKFTSTYGEPYGLALKDILTEKPPGLPTHSDKG